MTIRRTALLTALAAPAVVLTLLASGSTPSASAADSTTEPAARAHTVRVADLPRGRAAKIDVVLDRVLVHQARRIALPDDLASPRALGSYDSRAIVSIQDNANYASVGRDGDVRRLGGPNFSGYWAPSLVRRTGHVLDFAVDRDAAGTHYYTFYSARTGKVVKALRDRGGRPADLSSLAPADRRMAVFYRDGAPAHEQAASRDGRLVLDVRSPRGGATTVTVVRTRDRHVVTRFTFPRLANGRTGVDRQHFAFEDADTFLAIGHVPAAAGQPRNALLRCSTDGRCERASDAVRQVSIAGTRAVFTG